MVFSDLFFIFVFLPIFIVSYVIGHYIDKYRIRKASLCHSDINRPMLWRNISLVLFSLVFYSWGEPVYVLLMIITVILNYICGLLVRMPKSDSVAKLWLTLGVVINLAILGSFKYLGFFAEALVEIGINVDVPQIALPIGISFYIFQSISYLIDVYRKESPAQTNFFDLLLYIAMFPQLIAGPIVRYGTIANEINNRHSTLKDVTDGSYRFFIGLAKKVIFANILGEIATSLLSGDLSNLGMAAAWIGIAAFSLQIYFDFSGYSDMAIGLGRCTGFHFPENFDHPYTCTSMTDFWRKWHMSLGSFFRDYLYIPMGGNRRHQPINIMTVWFMTGLWHGASWNFVLWGLYFGLIIMIEKYTLLKWNIPRVFLHVYCILLLLIGWGLFYFDDFGRLGQFYNAFWGLNKSQGFPMHIQSVIMDNLWIWIFALLLCLPIRRKVAAKLDSVAETNVLTSYGVNLGRAMISIVILIVCVALLVGATNNAFIYTRF